MLASSCKLAESTYVLPKAAPSKHISPLCDARSCSMMMIMRFTHVLGNTLQLIYFPQPSTYKAQSGVQELGVDPDIYEKLTASIAPSIWQLDDVKKGILCQLFGGNTKVLILHIR